MNKKIKPFNPSICKGEKLIGVEEQYQIKFYFMKKYEGVKLNLLTNDV